MKSQKSFEQQDPKDAQRGQEGASDSFPLSSHYFRVKLCISSDKIFKYLLRFLPVAL